MSHARLPFAVVWIDSRQAIIARREAGTVSVDRLASDVPPHRRSTRHVRYDPTVSHGGGAPCGAGDARRLEHLAGFLKRVSESLPASADLIVVGPGTVHERLARAIRERDAIHGVARHVGCEVAARLTSRQIVARLGVASGDPARRRTAGPHGTGNHVARRGSEARVRRCARDVPARRPAPRPADWRD